MIITLEQLVNDAFLLTSQWDITRLPDDGDVSRGIGILGYIIGATPNCDIAFKDEFSFNLTPSKNSYTFGLVAGPGIDFVSPRIHRIAFAFLTLSPGNSVTYPLTILQEYEYYNFPRVLSSNGLPSAILLTNNIGISTVYFYLPPDQNYLFTMEYIKDLSDFVRETDISNVPAYQYKYFKYALAREICQVYNLNWTELQEKTYLKSLMDIQGQNFKDMTVRTSDMRGSSSTYRRILYGI